MNAYKKDFENALEMIEWQNTMLRQQQEQINNLKQWEKRQLDVIEALKAENKQLTEWLTKVGFVK